MSCSSVHSLVVGSHSAILAAENEEVVNGTLVALLPEALALLDLLVLSRGELVAVFLTHHDDGPITTVKSVASSTLTVTKQ